MASKFFRFFISRTFAINLGIMVAVTVVLLTIVFYSLDSYTHHGEEFHLPDFSGMTLDEVDRVCKSKDLRYEIIDSVYSRRQARGTVVEQNPEPDFFVKKGRRVFLVVNAREPELIPMPDVTGVDFQQSWLDLESQGLHLEALVFRPNDMQFLVLEQRYKGQLVFANEKIEKGSGITLVVGTGSDDEKMRGFVPNVRGLTLAQAQRKLFRAYMTPGVATFDATVLSYEDSLRAKVWKHRPLGSNSRKMRLGTQVNLWLSLDEKKLDTDTVVVVEPDSLDITTDEILNDSALTDTDLGI